MECRSQITMEKKNIASLNSPVIQKCHTPIKRLGLSRKRKSSGSECKLDSKIRAGSEIISSVDSEKHFPKKKIFTPTEDSDSGTADSDGINYDEEINILKKSISEKEEKLKAFQSKNIVQLEELIEIWKNGCKSAFLYFIELIKERQEEGIDFRSILTNLGIWEVMIDNFGNDPDLNLMDFS